MIYKRIAGVRTRFYVVIASKAAMTARLWMLGSLSFTFH